MDINEPISYRWTLGWDEGMVSPKPTVNRLLKAMIEKNANEMERLFQQGASLKKTDKETLQRVLYHVLDDYNVISCLIKHGFTSQYGAMLRKSDYYADDECWNPYAYGSGLPGRAWSLKSYKVLKLLVDQGFSKMSFSIKDQFYDAEELSYEREEIDVVKLFLENGRPVEHYEIYSYFRNYPNNKITQYLLNYPLIKRRSALLDPCLFKKIPEPKLVKVGFFGRKTAQEKNERILADHNDRIAAQKRFIQQAGVDTWCKEVQFNKELSADMDEMAEEIKRQRRKY